MVFEDLRVLEATYDAKFRSDQSTGLVSRLIKKAWGQEYVEEAAPSSDCTWAILATCLRYMRLSPQTRLLDLGSGVGGPGQWLCRAVNCHVVGVDISAIAIEMARQRAVQFKVGERCTYIQGTFSKLPIESESIDAAVSFDAFSFTGDVDSAVVELGRVLRPGAPVVFTSYELIEKVPKHPVATHDWGERLQKAGFCDIERIDLPGGYDRYRRLYRLLLSNEDLLLSELGPTVTDSLIEEARRAPDKFLGRRSLIVCARRMEKAT